MEEKMGEKLEELKGNNQLLREDLRAVSYTHLDVYKRQVLNNTELTKESNYVISI